MKKKYKKYFKNTGCLSNLGMCIAAEQIYGIRVNIPVIVATHMSSCTNCASDALGLSKLLDE